MRFGMLHLFENPLEKTENQIIRASAARYHVPLADVEALIIAKEPHGVPGETLFTDHCHLNEVGRSHWIRAYEPLIDQVVAEIR